MPISSALVDVSQSRSKAEKFVIAYRDHGNSQYGTAIVGTVSGTSISMGTSATFNSGVTSDVSAGYDSGSGKQPYCRLHYTQHQFEN